MKRTLLSSTALAVVLGFVGPVNAQEAAAPVIAAPMTAAPDTKVAMMGAPSCNQKPSLTMSGQALFSYHLFRNGNPKGEKGHGGQFYVEDSSLDFNVKGRMDWFGQMYYDWLLGITGDTAETKSVETNRLRVKGEWGTVLFGNHQGVENTMARGAFAVMGATGGFDGNMFTTIDPATGNYLTTDLVGKTSYGTKITYLTPRIYGVQLGVSYTPNSEHRGEGKNGAPHNLTSTKSPHEAFDMNSWAGGVNFKHAFDNGLNLALSATGMVASTRRPDNRFLPPAAGVTNYYTIEQFGERHNTASYALGGVVEFRGFEIGAEWIDNGKSRQLSNPGLYGLGSFDAGEAWSTAVAYTYGPDRVALGYYGSERRFNGQNVKADIYSATYDRKIAPGFSLYGEYNVFGFHSHTAAVNYQNNYKANAVAAGNSSSSIASGRGGNNGHVGIIGAKVQF